MSRKATSKTNAAASPPSTKAVAELTSEVAPSEPVRPSQDPRGWTSKEAPEPALVFQQEPEQAAPDQLHPREEEMVAYRQRYPLTSALMDTHKESKRLELPILRITAKRAGFRRAGMAHASTPTDLPVVNLSPDQIEALLAEPELVIEVV